MQFFQLWIENKKCYEAANDIWHKWSSIPVAKLYKTRDLRNMCLIAMKPASWIWENAANKMRRKKISEQTRYYNWKFDIFRLPVPLRVKQSAVRPSAVLWWSALSSAAAPQAVPHYHRTVAVKAEAVFEFPTSLPATRRVILALCPEKDF